MSQRRSKNFSPQRRGIHFEFIQRRHMYSNSDRIYCSKILGIRDTSTQRENIRIDEINKLKTNIEEKGKRNV